MKQPIEVRVTEGAGYIRYGDESEIDVTAEIIRSVPLRLICRRPAK